MTEEKKNKKTNRFKVEYFHAPDLSKDKNVKKPEPKPEPKQEKKSLIREHVPNFIKKRMTKEDKYLKENKLSEKALRKTPKSETKKSQKSKIEDIMSKAKSSEKREIPRLIKRKIKKEES